MALPEQEVVVEVRADETVTPGAAAEAVAMVRKVVTQTERGVRYAAVTLGIDDEWHGRRRHHVEATVDTVGMFVRGFAAGTTLQEALDELDHTLQLRLAYARRRLQLRR